MTRRSRSSCQALLQEVRAKCDHVPEISSMCLRAVARLEHLYDGVVALEETDPRWVKYGAALAQLDKITRRKPLLVRLATSRTIAQRVAAVQEDLDEVEHGVNEERGLAPWREQWNSDQLEQLANLREQLGQRSIRQLVSGVSLDQVLMDLEKELSRKDLPKDEHDLKETTFGRIMAYTDRKDVPCPDWFISESELDFDEGPSDVGQFAETLQATWYHDGKREKVIVKRLLAEIGRAASGPFTTQMEMWLQLDHPNVLKLLGGCHIGSQPFYVCEDPGSGNLADFFRTERSIVEYLRLFIQVAEGLAFLHEQGVVHGGLTVRNVLVGEAKTPKLSDFGLSAVRSLSVGMSVSSYQVRKEMHRWQPKEVLEGGAPRFESDVFMLGICMLEAIVGEELFGSQQRGDRITSVDTMDRPENVPETVWKLVCNICVSNVRDRISLEDAIEDMKHLVGKSESAEMVPIDENKFQYHQEVYTREKAGSFVIVGLQEEPSSTQALKDLPGRCRRMPEAEQLIKHVLHRLQLLHDDVANAEDDKLRAKYSDVMARFVNLLRRKALLLRLASSETIVLTIHGLQDKITEVAQLVGRADDPELSKWQESWNEDRAQQLVKLEKLVTGASDRMLVNEFRGDKKVQEALMALNSGISWKGQSPEMVEFKKTTFARVSSYLNKVGLRMFDWFIPIDDVEFGEEVIGSGTSGIVSRGVWFHDGQRTNVVVKHLFGETSTDMGDVFLRRMDLWANFPPSQYILKVYGGSHVSKPQFYVCENAPNGNIADFLDNEAHSVLFWRLFKQVAEGLKFLHEMNTIHGGLKCNNILVGDDYTPKLADFGGINSVRTLSAALGSNAEKASVIAVRWKAKEVLAASEMDPPLVESDIYSLAMCMIEAKSHEPPFGMMDNEEVIYCVMTGESPPREDAFTDEEWNFISRLCNSDYKHRPSLDEVIDVLDGFAVREEAAMSIADFGMSDSLRKVDVEEDASPSPTPTEPQVKTVSVCSSCTESSASSTGRCRYCGFSSAMIDDELFTRPSFATYAKVHAKTDILHRLYDIALILQDLRERSIVHANMVPGSIRIGHDGTAHLVGFGLNKTPVEPENSRWLAPECLSGSDPSFETNVYSFGMCMIYALSGEPPWGVNRSDEEIRHRVGQLHEIPSRPDKIDETEWEIVKKMCHYDPDKRMHIVIARRELAKLALIESSCVPEWRMAPDLISISDVVSSPDTSFVSHSLGYWKDALVRVDKVSKRFTTRGRQFSSVADLWFPLRHPTVLQLFGVYDDDKGACFVCEYAEYGNLRSYLRSNPDTAQVWSILRDAALALHYLHCEGVVHGDVGLHNIHVTGNGRGKLSGFYISSKNLNGHSTEDEPLCEEDWSPPMCSRGHRTVYESDVYSLGRCIIEAISGEVAQGKADPLSASLCARCAVGELPPHPDAFSPEEWRLVSDMCCRGIEMPEVVHRIARLAAVNTIVSEKLASIRPQLPPNARQAAQEVMLLKICELEKEDDEQEEYCEEDDEHDLMDQISYEEQAARDVFRANDESFVGKISTFQELARAQVELISAARFETHVQPRLSSIFKWTLHHESITQLKDADQINKGSFASVWKGTWLGATVALKKLKRVDQGQSLREEANLWFRVRHPNIVCLFGACCRSCQVFVCDLVDGGRLDEYCSVKKGDNSKEPKEFRPSERKFVKIWGFLHDAAVGLQGLHWYGIVHADLKCDNILVTKDMRRAKLIDFGLSCLSTSDGEKPQGAFRWKSPECLKDAGPTFASDVYSFGMCILQALSGAFPWGKTPDLTVIWEVTNGHLPPRPALLSDLQWDFVQRMCCFKPEDRLQVDQVVKVLGFFAQRDPYVNDQSIQETLAQWERDPLPVQTPRQQ